MNHLQYFQSKCREVNGGSSDAIVVMHEYHGHACPTHLPNYLYCYYCFESYLEIGFYLSQHQESCVYCVANSS